MTTTTEHGPLTISDACAIADIIRWAQGTEKIAWQRTGPGHADEEPLYGHARSIGNQDGGFLPRDADVRDGYLRITSRSGFELFIPVTTLIAAHRTHHVAQYDWR